MAYLIVSQHGEAPLPISTVDVGPYRLTRVSATDPALAGACDPQWSYLELFVLAPTGAAEPWEQRVAKELAAELGQVIEVTLAGEPTALAAPVQPPTERSPTPEPTVPVGEAFLVGARRVELEEVEAGDVGELTCVVRERLGFELPEPYVEMLLETGLPSRADDSHRFLRWYEIVAALTDDEFVPFYQLAAPNDSVENAQLAFDRDGTILEIHDGGIVGRSRTFARWIMEWRRGRATLDEDDVAPPDGRVIAQRWRAIAKWVRPMYRGEVYW